MRLKYFATVVAFAFGFVVLAVAPASAEPIEIKFTYTWSGEEANQSDLDRLDWIESGSSDFEEADECDSVLLFSCDIFPDAAPIAKAEASGTYSTGDFAGYNYTVPGGPEVYIRQVDAEGVSVTGPDLLSLETQGPTTFIGIWDGTTLAGGDATTETDTVEMHEEGEEGLNQVVFGMIDNGDPFSEDHWSGLMSMDVTLGDDTEPTATIEAPEEWIDETVTSIPIDAEDNGLGLLFALYRAAKRNPENPFDLYYSSAVVCEELFANEGEYTEDLCPQETPVGFSVPIDPAAIREGYRTLEFSVLDLAENTYQENIPIKIDTQGPTSSLGGSFMSAAGMVLDGALYELEVDAADGNATVHNSGVKKIQVLVDDVEIDSDTQSCPGDDCAMELDTDIEPDNWSNGEHELKVKVTDQVGHVKTTTVDFEVDR